MTITNYYTYYYYPESWECLQAMNLLTHFGCLSNVSSCLFRLGVDANEAQKKCKQADPVLRHASREEGASSGLPSLGE